MMFENYKAARVEFGSIPSNSDSAILMHLCRLRGDITAVRAVCCTRSSAQAFKTRH